MKTIIEPFRIKSVEPLHFTTKEQRESLIKEASYNPFLLKANDVLIDLLTDSGTGAMSSDQWAGIMKGDESYAGSESFFHFESTIRQITGMKYVIPTHQGRAAERILFSFLGGKGKFVISNTLFDTTRANIEYSGAEGIDLLCDEGKIPSVAAPFKGNINIEALQQTIKQKGAENISLVIITVTNNSGGGQPVSISNIRDAQKVCKSNNIPFYIDACRFAENAYFVQQREEEFKNTTIEEIAQLMFSYADGCTMSAKKDAFANIGGFLAINDEALAEQCRNLLIITEGFPSYGGLAGRDLEAISIGLKEVMHQDYLHYRIRSVEYMGEKLEKEGIPFLKPTGGHALYLDAAAFCSHIPASQYPGQALCCALYTEGGVRGVEIGSVMFGKYALDGSLVSPSMELVRLAFPRRVYTQSHFDYTAEVIVEVFRNRSQLKGLKIVYESPLLRHFTAKFKPV